MTEAQQAELMKVEIIPPDGYYFDDVNFEKDLETVTYTWHHAKEGDTELTR